jgi:alpha-L-fucosidase
LLLNIPPDKRGLIHEKDTALIKNFGDKLREKFKNDLAVGAKASASETMDSNHNVYNIFDGAKGTCWCPKEGTECAVIEIDLNEVNTFDRIVLMEYIMLGQRVEEFILEYKKGDTWNEFFIGTTIGYKRICCFEKIEARYVRVNITKSRWYPMISKLGIYQSSQEKLLSLFT